MNKLVVFAFGLVLGLAGGVFAVWNIMPSQMLTVHESALDFDQTVATIETRATEAGWQVPKIYNLQQSLIKAGHSDMTRLSVISLCQPDHAYNILSDDDNKRVAAMMPCRIGIYETADGAVRVVGMNMGLMSKMFGGAIEEVMGKVSSEEAAMLKGILREQ